jgi:hypothetical protein
VNFDGTLTTNNIRASANVSSVTRTGTGVYEINFITNMPNSDYCVSAIAGDSNGRLASLRDGVNQTTSRVTIQTWRFDVAGGAIDASRIQVLILV